MASNCIIQFTSSSSHAIKTYDVFVSFRGEDTRNNFTDFLFEALRRNGIEAFKDTEDLKKGESIAPELLKAIQGSRFFVVVFSENYASSTWCLRELVEICNCIETSPRQLLPVFYDVDPSEVRKQSGCYGQAFSKHAENFKNDEEKMEEVLRWKQALAKVGGISGSDIRNKPQSAEIEKIVRTIKQKLGSRFSSLPEDNLVGMESRVEELERFLHSESVSDVRFVGISGMGGVGKTTLARAFFERFSHRYNVRCFIEDVSHTHRKDCGALGVLKQLLSQHSKEKNIEICNVIEGTEKALSTLCGEKALIFIDNVDQDEQLNIFSGSRKITVLRQFLAGGSRVVIVSRDEHILKTHEVDDVYKVEPLNGKYALQLFCRKAFNGDCIINGYEKLTHDILWHVEGHPLTIEVIGSSLLGRSIPEWRGTLAKLRNNQSENIMNKLRIGFDELDGTEKKIFLDIACLFEDYFEEEYVKEILDFREFYPDSGLQVLIDKSLITINKRKGEIHMHNLLRDLGKYIVREKSPNEPAKWSRLWALEDLRTVLSDNMEETNIEAIVVLDTWGVRCETIATVNALSKMRNLKLLILSRDIECSGSLDDLSNELGYVTWPRFPCESLPLCFQPRKLVDLLLSESNIKELWEDTKAFPKLRRLDLSDSKNLIKMQNLGEAINLEILNLQGCIRLEQFDSSSSFPKNLTTLNLKDCRSLINLPHFREALNLGSIDMEGCAKLRQIDSSILLLRKLHFLNLKGCKSLVSLPISILKLESLEYLGLFGCSQLYSNLLLEEPRDAEHSKKLCTGEAPSHSQSMSAIVKRSFTWFSSLYSRKQNESVNWMLPSLSIFSCMAQLDMSFCNLVQVPGAIGKLHSLESLSLRGNNFGMLPSLKELSKLVHLNLQHCKRLKYLPELPSRTNMSSSRCSYVLSPPRSSPISSMGVTVISFSDENVLGLNCFNCPELAKSEDSNKLCFPWIKKILEGCYIYRPRYWPERFSSIIPGSEIPTWFDGEHVCTDNLIRIDSSADKDWIGVVCSAIFVAGNPREMAPPKEPPHSVRHIQLLFREDIITVESDHQWLFYFDLTFIDVRKLDNDDDDEVVILDDDIWPLKIVGSEDYGVEVKKYGYRFVHQKDVLLSNLLMPSETSLPRKLKIEEIE